MKHPSTVGAGLALGAVAVLLASCSPGPATPDVVPVEGGTLVIAEAFDAPDVNPSTSFYDTTWRINDMVYDSLVTTNENAEILPSIAESWVVDGDVYTFTLRDDVRFSNGRALTVDDVVGSLNRLLQPETGSFWLPQLGPVESIEALDDFTVQVTLAAAWEPFLPALASTTASILPMEELEAGTFDPTVDMLGTGPFKVDEHLPDQSWTLSRNDEHWAADGVSLDAVEIRFMPDDNARISALRDGSVDIAFFSSPDAPTLLGAVPNVETTTQGSSDSIWLILNAVNPESPFVDEDLRTAIAMAVDRDRLIETPLAGQGEPTGVTPATLPGSCATDDLATYGGGPEAAQEFMAERGIDPVSFTIMAPPYGPVFSDVTEFLQQDFIAAGFDVSIETPEIGVYIEREFLKNPAEFEVTVDYLAGYLSPTMVVQALLIPDQSAPGFGGFTLKDPEVERLVAAANAAPDDAERADLLQQLCDQVAESANIIPLATRSTTVGVRADQVLADVPEWDGFDVYLRNVTEYQKLG